MLIVSLGLDLSFAKVITRYPKKLTLSLSFIFATYMFLDYTAVLMKLWEFKPYGITGIYLYQLPMEEYLFMIVAPYAAIVLWETINRILIRR